jgi:hypothetical protein
MSTIHWLNDKLFDDIFYEWGSFVLNSSLPSFHLLDEVNLKSSNYRLLLHTQNIEIWCLIFGNDYLKDNFNMMGLKWPRYYWYFIIFILFRRKLEY